MLLEAKRILVEAINKNMEIGSRRELDQAKEALRSIGLLEISLSEACRYILSLEFYKCPKQIRILGYEGKMCSCCEYVSSEEEYKQRSIHCWGDYFLGKARVEMKKSISDEGVLWKKAFDKASEEFKEFGLKPYDKFKGMRNTKPIIFVEIPKKKHQKGLIQKISSNGWVFQETGVGGVSLYKKVYPIEELL